MKLHMCPFVQNVIMKKEMVIKKRLKNSLFLIVNIFYGFSIYMLSIIFGLYFDNSFNRLSSILHS